MCWSNAEVLIVPLQLARNTTFHTRFQRTIALLQKFFTDMTQRGRGNVKGVVPDTRTELEWQTVSC